MTDIIQSEPASEYRPEPIALPANPAVAHCCKAYLRAQKAARDKGRFTHKFDGEAAYRNAMPTLSGIENIRDFIACTAHAMLIGAISGQNGARLLYAAQVAGAFVDKPRPIGAPGSRLPRPPAEESSVGSQVALGTVSSPSQEQTKGEQ